MIFTFAGNETLENLDIVPEEFRAMFQKQNDGTYQLGEAYGGVAKAIDGLNKSLKASRFEAKEAKKKSVDLSKLADYGESVDQIAETIASLKEAAEKKSGEAKVNVDKIRQEIAASMKADLDKEKTRSQNYYKQLEEQMVGNVAAMALAEAKGNAKLLMPHVRTKIKMQENDKGVFEVFVVDDSGDQRYSTVTGQPLSIPELISEMRKDPTYGPAFASEAPSGGGAQQSGRVNRTPNGANMSPVDKIAAGLGSNRRHFGAAAPDSPVQGDR